MRERWIKIFDYITEYSLYGLIFFLPISKAAIEILFGFALLGFLIKKIMNPDFKFIKSWQHLFLLLFLIFSTLSIFNSGPYFAKSLKALFFKWLEYIFIFLIAQDTLSSPLRVRRALTILLIMAGIVGIDGLSQRFLGMEFLRHKAMIEIKEGTYAISGPFCHYNDFGAYLVVVLSLSVGIFLLGELKGKARLFLTAAGILLVACLLLTLSRGAWLGFFGSLILMLVLSRKYKVLSTILCAFAMVLLLPGIKERAVLTFQRGGDMGRIFIWQGAWAMIKERPFLGKGLGTFMDYLPHYAAGLGVQYAHNCFLQIWAESGIFSLLSFLLFAGSILYKGIKAFKKNPDPFLLGLLSGIFGFLIHSFFDTQFYSLQLSALFWLASGLLYGLKINKN